MIKPSIIKEALSSTNSIKWKDAIKSEINSLIKNHTWDLVKRPQNYWVVLSKWVFKIKTDGRYKAQLITRGCM